MIKVQIVEDDKTLNNGIAMALGGQNMRFVQCYSIADAKNSFNKTAIDAVILDINLPDGSGYDYLRWTKDCSDIPVLILTANDMEMDEVMSLQMGADDYISKPFSLAVLRARIDALLRRRSSAALFKDEPFCFDFAGRCFVRNGEELQLSQTEQTLLQILTSNPDQIVSREVLLDRIWDHKGEFVDENALSVTIGRLRKKLSAGEAEDRIETVYGQGYRWRKRS